MQKLDIQAMHLVRSIQLKSTYSVYVLKEVRKSPREATATLSRAKGNLHVRFLEILELRISEFEFEVINMSFNHHKRVGRSP